MKDSAGLAFERYRADTNAARVAELEEALRELLAADVDDVDSRLPYVYIQVTREDIDRARAVLEGKS